MNNEGKDAVLSREQIEEYEYDLSDLCSGPHDLGKVNAMAAMARRYRDVLEQEPVAWKERAEFAERKLAEAVAALRKFSEHCPHCKAVVDEATK